MKTLFTLALLFSQHTMAADWAIKIKDISTSEVKTYSFTQVKTHKLETPKIKGWDCVLTVQSPEDVGDSKEHTNRFQRAELLCHSSSGGVIVPKVCASVPSELDKVTPTVVQVIDESSSSKKKGAKNPFLSYQITLNCE